MSDLRKALEARERRLDLAETPTMKRTQVEVHVDVRRAGETRAEIRFPVIFAEKPIFTFGGELAAGSTAEVTNYPVISVMVDGNAWKTLEKSDQRTYYTGCELLIVCLGKEAQRAVAHCLFEGLAFRDPAVGGTRVGGPI